MSSGTTMIKDSLCHEVFPTRVHISPRHSVSPRGVELKASGFRCLDPRDIPLLIAHRLLSEKSRSYSSISFPGLLVGCDNAYIYNVISSSMH